MRLKLSQGEGWLCSFALSGFCDVMTHKVRAGFLSDAAPEGELLIGSLSRSAAGCRVVINDPPISHTGVTVV